MRRSLEQQSGMALVTVLMLSTLMLVLLGGAAKMVLDSQKDTVQQFVKHGQASNIAQAGLQDAIGWFKRQDAQPVNADAPACADTAFAPVYDTDELISDTVDASVGLVRDLKITGNVYGRYIVKKNTDCDSPEPRSVRDYTAMRGKGAQGGGVVWYLESQGIVYQRNDFTKNADGYSFALGPDEPPNRVLSDATAAVEISRIAIALPKAPLTLFGTSGASAFNSRCGLVADQTSESFVSYFSGGPTPNISSAEKSGTPIAGETVSMSDAATTEYVFAVSENELRGMADNVYSNIDEIPNTIEFSITYLEGNYTFTTAKPLQGSGLLYINGDVTFSDASNSLFSGVIYVDGRIIMGRDNSLSGATLARRVTCTPGSGQSAFEYNDTLVNNVRRKLGLYRANNLTHTTKQ